MKMTVRESLNYIRKGNGTRFDRDTFNKMERFIRNLPQNPSDAILLNGGTQYTIKDYFEGWFAVIQIYHLDGRIMIEIVDGDNLDADENRVKSNTEALNLMKELKGIVYAHHIDKYWHMTDDHKYWRRMNEMDKEAIRKSDEIKRRL
ncbi:hypothetical protein PQE75_gp031 [Bacillus phage vB_BcoS-136]|uniref:Uncharacterized protein n=1 Tax=Bacillus phage vB_BcoS-136 TaxID=2419619 RepID=A0A3G3BVA7_9CAUD|nr:hypothetical protein PQE75_gp031 [Bacillus phage vB_BcoS-136]AYP68163.1 hypothetical protein vBBcoS136_00031 [Bacillus phage vB_BcoS-136]